MSLQEKIKDDLRISLKSGDTSLRDLLRVIISEMDREGKVLTDEQVIKILKKGVSNSTECGNLEEVVIFNSYLPQSLTIEEARPIIDSICKEYEKPDMGKIIAECKIKFGNKFDGKIIASLIKEYYF